MPNLVGNTINNTSIEKISCVIDVFGHKFWKRHKHLHRVDGCKEWWSSKENQEPSINWIKEGFE